MEGRCEHRYRILGFTAYTVSSLCIYREWVVWETQWQISMSGWFNIPAVHSIDTEVVNPAFPPNYSLLYEVQ